MIAVIPKLNSGMEDRSCTGQTRSSVAMTCEMNSRQRITHLSSLHLLLGVNRRRFRKSGLVERLGEIVGQIVCGAQVASEKAHVAVHHAIY